MFEIRFVIGSGREQHRVTAGAAGEAHDGIAMVAEKRRQALHAEIAEEFRKRLADDDAVFESVAEPGRRIGVAGVHGPRPVGHPRDVHRVEVNVHAAGRGDALECPQILRMAEDQVGRHDAVPQQTLLAVDIVQDRVCQPGALRRGRFDDRPVVGTDDKRGNVELPEPIESRRFVIRVVRDAVFADHPRGRLDAMTVFVGPHRGKGCREALPVRAHGTRTVE